MSRATDKLGPFQKAMSKAHLASAGVSANPPDHKPLIAIANSWSEICPGRKPLKQLAEEVKKGILEASSEPIEFSAMAICDGIAQGHSGARYYLPHREIITDSIEAVVVGEGVFDGVVYMDSCDKIMPGVLSAAARIDLPSVTVTTGPYYAQIKPNESKEPRQQFLRGEITKRQLIEGTFKYYTGPGICPFLGTANTMGVLCESLGMTLPRGSLIPSNTSMHRFSARESGRAVMEMVEMQIRPSRIMTQETLKNTTILLSATGGSLNALIHLPTLAAEPGISLNWDDFSKITTTTPILCSIIFNGNRTVVDLHCAGEVPAAVKELESVMNKDVLTVTGETLGQILERTPQGDRRAIKSIDEPVSRADGIQMPYSNLAPRGALVKTSAVLTGVRRCEGPKGDPGMKELHRITEIIKGIPNTTIIADSRFLRANGGLSIDYLCPEAAGGGPIALAGDGDRIAADLCKDYPHLGVSDEKLGARRREWKAVTRPREKGFLDRYIRLVNTARSDAILNRE